MHFLGLHISEQTFSCDQRIRKLFKISTFFSNMWVPGKMLTINQYWGIHVYDLLFLGRKFWCQVFCGGVKFLTHIFFWLCNIKLCQAPHHVYCENPLPPWCQRGICDDTPLRYRKALPSNWCDISIPNILLLIYYF